MTQRHEKVLMAEFSNEQVCFGMENDFTVIRATEVLFIENFSTSF